MGMAKAGERTGFDAGSVLPPPGGLKPRTGSGGNLIYKCCQTVGEKVTLKWLRCVLYLNVCNILSLKPSCWLGSI